MDKFDIHKWQRQALLTESKRFDFHPLHTEERMKAFSVEKKRLVNKYSNIDDGDTLRYIVEHLYDFIVDGQHLNKDMTTEEVSINTDLDVEELNHRLKSQFDSAIEKLVKQDKEGELRALVNKIESQTGIDIPDKESEVGQISKEDIITLGETLKDLTTISEDKEFKPPTPADIVGTLGLLAVTIGAASNVTVPGTGIPSAVVGILLLRLAIYLDSKNQDDN